MYLLRYTPQAMRDMDSVWDEVYQASKSYDIADKYIKDFIDTITKKKPFPTSGIPLRYKGLFTGFYFIVLKKYMAFYRIKDDYIEVLIRKADGEEWLLEIDKDYDDDLGIEFDNGLMSDYRSCSNKCIFCFIDQMPPGMRETLYFKDDDS